MVASRRLLQIVILSAVVVIGGFTIGNSLFSDSSMPRERDKAPAFTLIGLDGKLHSLEDYRGKMVLINFWGTFCEPCKREMPAIQQQYEKWADQDFVVLAINLGESPVTAQSFIRNNDLTFTVLMDPNLEIRNRYRVTNYPSSFFINKEGRIVLFHEGMMDENFINDRIVAMQ